MSASGTDKIPLQPGQVEQHYYPPPPPGPPPSDAANPQQQHPNETPIPDYDIPAYDPSKLDAPHFAGPSPTPTGLYDDDDPPPHHADAKPSGWSQRFSEWGTKAAAPLNALANKMGSEAFLPTTMDKECEKAARILRAFCKDGIYSDNGDSNSAPQTAAATKGDPASKAAAATSTTTTTAAGPNPKSKSRVLLTIPSKVIARAQGLLIFTTVRAGFHVTGASGSGILVARLPDGSWSPPSGVQVHSLGAGFVLGLDIYDCVVVINTHEALDAFTRTRMSLGSDLAVAAGPWGAGGMVDWGLPQEGKGKGKSKDGAEGGRERGRMGDEKPVGTTSAPADTPADLPTRPLEAPPPTTTFQPQPQVTTGAGTAPAPTISVSPATAEPQQSPTERRPSPSPSPSPLRDALRRPVYSYVKSRGFYAGVQVDGTVVVERRDANAAFYGGRAPVSRILAGGVEPRPGPDHWPAAARTLVDVLRGAEGWRGHSDSQPHPRGPTVGFAEAAAEPRANVVPSPGPPAYTESTAVPDDLPPAYVDVGQAPRPGVGDGKTGLH